MTESKRGLLPYLALAVVCIGWGTTFLALRVGVLEFPAFLFSALRQITAGIILGSLILSFRKLPFPDKKSLINQAIAGFLMITVGNGLVGWAEIYVPSGIAAIICSMVPIWVIILNLVTSKEERPTWQIILGMLIGLSGIVLIFGGNVSEMTNTAYTTGIAVIFLANIGWAAGGIWMKRKNNNSDPFMNAALQMVFGGIFLLPLSFLFDNYNKIQWSANVTVALIYLIFIGSVASYACFSYAVKKLPITIVSLYAYINPIVAVLLGWLILDEVLNMRIGIAIGVTLTGIYIVNRGYKLRSFWKSPLAAKTE